MAKYHAWTEKEHAFLVRHYKHIGDKELAKMFDSKFPRNDGAWTLKHIEKRRSYFNLKRTKAQEKRLRRAACVLGGSSGKNWDTRGRMKEGEIREWNYYHGGTRKYIKLNGQIIALERHLTKANKGQVATRDGLLLSRSEHAIRNKRSWLNASPELKQTITVLNKLKSLLNGKENRRS